MSIPSFRLSSFYFIYLAALGLFSPFFPLFLDKRDFSAQAISFTMALWFGARIFSPSTWSYLTTRSSNPINWLRIGTLLTLLFFIGFLFELSLIATIWIMLAFSFFCNAIMPQFEAITLSHLHENPQKYGRIRLWGSTGFMLTVTLGGILFNYIDIALLPYIMLPMYGLLLLVTFFNDYGPSHQEETKTASESMLTSLRRPGVRAFLAAGFLMQIAHCPYFVFYSLFLKTNGYSEALVGGFWAFGILVEIVMFWFSAQLLSRFGAVRLMRLSMGVAAIRFILTALFPHSIALLLAAQVGHSLSFGLFHSASMLRTTRLFPGRLLGQGQGLWYGLSSGVGGVLGSILAGKMWAIGGGRAAFLCAALTACIGFWVTWRLMQPGIPKSKSDVS
jgi:PPP family 3-phenylpropionic acid transporter